MFEAHIADIESANARTIAQLEVRNDYLHLVSIPIMHL